MQLARRRNTTANILKCGGLSSATRLRPYLAAGMALVGASAIAAMPVTSHPPETQARELQLNAVSATEAGEIVSAGGSLGTVEQDGLSIESPVSGGDLPDYSIPYSDLFTNTFDNLKGLGQGVPAGTALQSSVSDVAGGLGEFSAALRTALGDLSSGGLAGAPSELRTALLTLLVTLNLKVVLLQTALLNLLVTLNGNVVPESFAADVDLGGSGISAAHLEHS